MISTHIHHVSKVEAVSEASQTCILAVIRAPLHDATPREAKPTRSSVYATTASALFPVPEDR
jgi:hypothetical protein